MVLLVYSEQIDWVVNSVVQLVSVFSQEVNGLLMLGIGVMVCIYFFLLLLQYFCQQYLLLMVGVIIGNMLDIVCVVEENWFDFGLVMLFVQGCSLVVIVMLDEEFVIIYVSCEMEMLVVYIFVELQVQLFIVFEVGSGMWDLIDCWFCLVGLVVMLVMQLGSIEVIKCMVWVGLGYSIVFCMVVEWVEDCDGLCVYLLVLWLY